MPKIHSDGRVTDGSAPPAEAVAAPAEDAVPAPAVDVPAELAPAPVKRGRGHK